MRGGMADALQVGHLAAVVEGFAFCIRHKEILTTDSRIVNDE